MVEYGLPDSKDANDLATRLDSHRESWENISPGFHKWFVSKRKAIFQNSAIECAKENANVHGIFYNNSTDCQHYPEKKKQSFREETVEDFMKLSSQSWKDNKIKRQELFSDPVRID